MLISFFCVVKRSNSKILKRVEKTKNINNMGSCAYCGKWYLATFLKTYDGKGVCTDECLKNYNKYR